MKKKNWLLGLLTIISAFIGGGVSNWLLVNQFASTSTKAVQTEEIQFLDDKGNVGLILGTERTPESAPEGYGLVIKNSRGEIFCRIWPGIFNLKYPQRKGGGSFLWAGPSQDGGGEFQIISKNLRTGAGPSIKLEVDSKGSPSMALYTDGKNIAYLGEEHRSMIDPQGSFVSLPTGRGVLELLKNERVQIKLPK